MHTVGVEREGGWCRERGEIFRGGEREKGDRGNVGEREGSSRKKGWEELNYYERGEGDHLGGEVRGEGGSGRRCDRDIIFLSSFPVSVDSSTLSSTTSVRASPTDCPPYQTICSWPSCGWWRVD